MGLRASQPASRDHRRWNPHAAQRPPGGLGEGAGPDYPPIHSRLQLQPRQFRIDCRLASSDFRKPFLLNVTTDLDVPVDAGQAGSVDERDAPPTSVMALTKLCRLYSRGSGHQLVLPAGAIVRATS
jgi:hypothetical protein